MTDTRATDRLLEFIAEQRAIATNWTTDLAAKDALEQIERAVTELRRRGDTLVRREDLRHLLEALDYYAGIDELKATERPALERIRNALGGT